MTTAPLQQQNLWALAIDTVQPGDRAQLDLYQANKIAALDNVLTLVKGRQSLCLQKRWKYKKASGKVLIVEDLVEKVAAWVQRFVKVGDIAIQYDPSHAALPWSGIRFLLQISVNDAQTFGTIAEGVEKVSRLIARYALFEAVYLPKAGKTFSATQLKLSEALVSLYSAILIYLARAGRYYNQSTGERLARSIARSAETVSDCLKQISHQEVLIEQYAHIIRVELTSTVNNNVEILRWEANTSNQSLERLIQSLDGPLVRLTWPLETLQNHMQIEEQRSILRWLSTIRYREHHKHAYSDVIPSTGSWLFLKDEYINWRHSSSSSILWLHGFPGVGKANSAR